jgi:hypothetical protein
MSQTLIAVVATAVITAILSFLLTFSFVHASFAARNKGTQAKDPSLDEKTYRVQGIPAAYTHSSGKQLLQSALGLEDESSRVEIHSLARSPYEPRDNASKVATFTFTGGFKYLPRLGKRWAFPIPEDEDSNNNVPSRKLQISIDSDFEGFTPLNPFETGEEHKIE